MIGAVPRFVSWGVSCFHHNADEYPHLHLQLSFIMTKSQLNFLLCNWIHLHPTLEKYGNFTFYCIFHPQLKKLFTTFNVLKLKNQKHNSGVLKSWNMGCFHGCIWYCPLKDGQELMKSGWESCDATNNGSPSAEVIATCAFETGVSESTATLWMAQCP